MNYVRRFVFVHYEDLLEVRFRQLEKVTDKLYVFVPAGVAEVPFWLVRQMQDMGRDLTWVDIGEADYASAQALLAFHAGTLHEQVDPGVEFAILSDAEGLDALVAYVQSAGRNCVRVKRRPQSMDGPRASAPSGKTDGTPPRDADGGGVGDDDADDGGEADPGEVEDLDLEAATGEVRGGAAAAAPLNGGGRGRHDGDHRDESDGGDATDETDVEALLNGLRDETASAGAPRARGRTLREPLDRGRPADATAVAPLAEDIVRKLVRSGNRPADLPMLRSYILLHGPDASAGRYVDEIIDAMADKGEIEVAGEEVRYGF